MRRLKIGLGVIAAAVIATLAFLHLAPEKVLGLAIGLERSRSGLTAHAIDLPDGLHYAYLEGGQGEPLILLHGFGADKDNFTRVARFLTRHWHVIIPDHIGFGESSHPPEADYAPPAQVDRLRALAHALGLGPVHLGGSSMGGQIAMTWAALHRDEVASLWLIDPAGVWSAPESELQKVMRETGRNPLMASTVGEYEQVFAFVMTDPPVVPHPLLAVKAQERIRNQALEQRIFQQIRADSTEVRIAGLATPSLIVWGAQDRAINVATAEVLHRLLPNSRVIIMPGVGHLPMLERPARSAADYIQFRTTTGK